MVTKDKLQDLFDAIINNLLTRAKEGTLSASDMNNVRNLLRDNGINVDATDTDESINDLAKEAFPDLPDLDDKIINFKN